jgi:hypothetical protein
MNDMAELAKRKQKLNLAIVYTDPDAFLANIMGWLEITAFITAVRAGEAVAPADGSTPTLDAQQLKSGGVANVASDALFAFCMTAALKGDKPAVDKVEAGMIEMFGKDYPGSTAMWSFNSKIETPVSLEDFVGQAAQKMLAGDIPPPPMRAKDNWNAGLRFFEKARKSNFVQEVMYPLARWHRERWTDTLDKHISFLAHIEDNLPVLREVLGEQRNDEPFIANLLLKMGPAVEMDMEDDMQGFLRSLARRV